MGDSEPRAEEEEDCNPNIRYLHSQTLANHGQRIIMLEQRNRQEQAVLVRIENKIDSVDKGIGDLSQSYGNVIVKISSLDEKVASISKIHMGLSDKATGLEKELTDHRSFCRDTHKDLSHTLSNITDDDSLDDIPTGIIRALSGKEVKSFIGKERRERLLLQGKVDSLVKEKMINDREKAAVMQAKADWEMEHRKMIDENHKTKIARYGLYSGIAVALITALATIGVAVLR